MAKKSFKDSSCPFCGLDLTGKQSEKLSDGKGACPHCAHSLELRGVKSQKPETEAEQAESKQAEEPAEPEVELAAPEPETPEQEPEPETPPAEE